MARFTTRVELHNASGWQDYANLHEAMRKQGFTQTITSDDGVTYELPPAEYNLIGSLARDAVLARAKTAAASIGFPVWTASSGDDAKTCSILVSEATSRTWMGLKPA